MQALLQLWCDAMAETDDDRSSSHQRGRERVTEPVTEPYDGPDIATFEAVYRARFEALCDYAYTFLHSRDEARDTVQNVFLRLWQRKEQVWQYGDPVGYLVTATRNAAISTLRQRAVRQRHSRFVEEPYLERQTKAVQGHDFGPTDNTLIDQVYEFIDALPPRTREVLILRWQHGLSIQQIAKAMRIGVPSVRVAHARGIAILKERFGLR